MAREYFPAYHSYLESMEALTDDERGRLFTACLLYSKTGEAPQLSGNERYVFPSFRAQIDRDTKNYSDFSASQSEKAKKRWNAAACTGISGNAEHAKEKEKEREKENNTHPTLPREVLGIAGLAVSDNARIAQEAVQEWFSQHGYACRLEVPVPDRGDGYTGRIDLLATKGSVQVAVEIDRVSAREKSLYKLRQFACCRAVLVRNGTSENISFVEDGTAIIPLRATKSDEFDRFWSEYPKKVGKIAARKAFERASRVAALETLLTAIRRQKCGSQWSRENGRYIPNPATWLNQGRWEDEEGRVEAPAAPRPYHLEQVDGEEVLVYDD